MDYSRLHLLRLRHLFYQYRVTGCVSASEWLVSSGSCKRPWNDILCHVACFDCYVTTFSQEIRFSNESAWMEWHLKTCCKLIFEVDKWFNIDEMHLEYEHLLCCYQDRCEDIVFHSRLCWKGRVPHHILCVLLLLVRIHTNPPLYILQGTSGHVRLLQLEKEYFIVLDFLEVCPTWQGWEYILELVIGCQWGWSPLMSILIS